MPIAYDPSRPLVSLFSGTVRRTLASPLYISTMATFLIFRVAVGLFMSASGAKEIDTALTYPVTLIGTLFSFLIGFFVNNCFTRFMDNWRAAMVGWSRINDLALQVHAYVADRQQACEVMRLMNAANHLCYGDLAGQNMIDVALRRHLLTDDEAQKLRQPGGPPPFYKVSSWALETLADTSPTTTRQPVDRVFVLAMDKSIIEWRQQTTLLPMIQMNPLPFPYYRNMVLLLVVFEVRAGAATFASRCLCSLPLHISLPLLTSRVRSLVSAGRRRVQGVSAEPTAERRVGEDAGGDPRHHSLRCHLPHLQLTLPHVDEVIASGGVVVTPVGLHPDCALIAPECDPSPRLSGSSCPGPPTTRRPQTASTAAARRSTCPQSTSYCCHSSATAASSLTSIPAAAPSSGRSHRQIRRLWTASPRPTLGA